jgi:hypothetical protein
VLKQREAGAYDHAVSFYDDVLRELITAVGAALFLGNLIALVRRRPDRSRVPARRSPDTLPQAPLTRTVFYLLIGFVVMVAGIAAIATK